MSTSAGPIVTNCAELLTQSCILSLCAAAAPSLQCLQAHKEACAAAGHDLLAEALGTLSSSSQLELSHLLNVVCPPLCAAFFPRQGLVINASTDKGLKGWHLLHQLMHRCMPLRRCSDLHVLRWPVHQV